MAKAVSTSSSMGPASMGPASVRQESPGQVSPGRASVGPDQPAAMPAASGNNGVAQALMEAARALSDAVDGMRFPAPVAHVYNPLAYARRAHELYLTRFGNTRKQVVFVGMNPGPFGMMQTGVPFGEIAAVRDWMGICEPVDKPALEHPRRPIEGFDCARSEVSGRRLYAWAEQTFGEAAHFFARCFVLNYCPLVFLEVSGRNYTPEKLPAASLAPLQQACDAHLRRALAALEPQWVIGIGSYARQCIERVLAESAQGPAAASGTPRVGQVLHPSPASPAANRGWAQAAQAQLTALGVFADGL
jgi:single-strand selective monofunctional uracil DNA glycosylase